MTTVARLLLKAQLAFWGCMVVCFAVTGGGLSHNHGFSIYGGRWTTILPWAAGFVAAAYFILRAASLLDDGDHALAQSLRVTVALLLGVLFTPDTVDAFFYDAHIVASVLLFLFEAIVGLWLVQRVHVRAVLQLYVIQIVGGIVAAMSQAQWIGLLSPGILVFQVSFGALLVTASTEPHTQLETV
ncbi:MAG TPA: hypothetical protein VFA97_12095 [Gaiellaceae bacterium]|nr:hypothetical protein [Gaiellaceae bacterium]